MNRRLAHWQRTFLHAVLIGSSVAFLLPYVWLVGTSMKLDKEVQQLGFRITPTQPRPRDVSPYVDPRTFAFERPDDIDPQRWDGWLKPMLEQEIGRAIDEWRDPRAAPLDPDVLRGQLIAGVFHRVRAVLPAETWSSDAEAVRAAAQRIAPESAGRGDANEIVRTMIRRAASREFVAESFERCYREFAVGKVLMKDIDYRVHDLTPMVQDATNKNAAQLLPHSRGSDQEQGAGVAWHVVEGPVGLEPRTEAERTVTVLHYDFSRDDAFEVAADLPLAVAWDRFKRLDISFRRDETWHEMRALLEINGVLYRSAAPRYLGEDTWWEASFQLPGPDDQRLIPHRYVLLDRIDAGPRFDHGRDVLRLRIRLSRSSQPEAWWAKASENYRKVFEEVPFRQYLKTSVFLAIVNILGNILSCSMIAYALARLNWPGRGLCFYLVLATLMIPPQITMIPSFVIYRQLGLYNTLAPLWLPGCMAVNAFGIFLLRQAMKGIPRDLEDAARIDGCGYFRTFWHVALPEMKPTLAAISIFTFMYVWNDFMGPLIYVNDQRLYPLALGLFSLTVGKDGVMFTLIMAAATIMTLPVIALFFVAQRYFIQGVTMSGLKG